MGKKCVVSHKKNTECIKYMRKCVGVVAQTYKHCLTWLATIVNRKVEIDSIDSYLNRYDQSFDILKDNDGAKKEKINTL